ncbi:MAG TPA: GNAT family N-acetyltransferase [Candidatus Binatia bacterium]
MPNEITLKVVRKIADVPQRDWDALAGEGSPFLKWDWLDSLEQTGCVSESTGWLPHHLIAERGREIIGACPMYLKLHSMGEFVFDYEWADAAHRLGIQYYPKLLVGVPFTPVTGGRFLTRALTERKSLIRLMGQALAKIAGDNKISSVHVNFCLPDEQEALEEVGFLPRVGLQFHWQNRGFSSFDDYLASFRSDRRNKIKRERREMAQQGISIRAVQGDELTPSHARTMFRLYKGHVDNLYYGRQYLTREFFDAVLNRFAEHLCLIFAESDGRIIAGTFNVRGGRVLYGRYWGAFEERPFLHFNVCYYSAIEHCIRNGWERFEAGAGGSFKQLRGLDPEPTASMHFMVDQKFAQAVARYLKQERQLIREKRAHLLNGSQIKRPPDQP